MRGGGEVHRRSVAVRLEANATYLVVCLNPGTWCSSVVFENILSLIELKHRYNTSRRIFQNISTFQSTFRV